MTPALGRRIRSEAVIHAMGETDRTAYEHCPEQPDDSWDEVEHWSDP